MKKSSFPVRDLEWQLRSAADGLRRSIDVLPDQEMPAPRRHYGRTAAIALLVVAIVGGAVLIWTGDERINEPKVTTGPDVEVTPLVLDPAPDGYPDAIGTDLPLDEADTLPGTMSITVYSGTLAFDGNAQVDLGVVVVHDESLSGFGEPTTIRGHAGEVADSGSFRGPTVTWEEAPDLEITLASHTLDTALLLELAEGLRVVDTSERTDVFFDRLPAAIGELRPVGGVGDVEFRYLVPVPRSAEGHHVQYAGDDGIVTVASAEGDASVVAALAWAFDVEGPYTAGRRSFYVGSLPADPSDPDHEAAAGIWLEDSNVVGYIAATQLSRSELMRLVAEDLREADDAEWDDLAG
jgi:hypothetical protein